MTKQPSIRLLAPQAELADVSKHFDLALSCCIQERRSLMRFMAVALAGLASNEVVQLIAGES